MKRISTFITAATLAFSLMLPVWAQTQIAAPLGWTSQAKASGAVMFRPPDLAAGEKYSVTVYDSAPMNGKTPEAYLRGFAGSVGTKPGNLAAPLKIETQAGKVASGIGAYVGPNGAGLGVLFIATSLDGASIHVARTLFSNPALFSRYADRQGEIVASMGRRALDERQSALADGAPATVTDNLTRGIALVPGVYGGQQIKTVTMFGTRRTATKLRVYLYPNGEYRIANGEDEDFKGWERTGTGTTKYNAKHGRLDITDLFFHLSNDNTKPDDVWCYYGRGTGGKPTIYAHENYIGDNYDTVLIWQGPPTGRVAQSVIDAPAKAAEAKAAADKAKRDLIQTTVAPGRGVPASQVAAIVHNFKSVLHQTLVSAGGSYIIPNFGGLATYGYNAPIYGLRQDITDDTYLLLRDGTVYRGLETAPDQFDVAASRQKEPGNWGLWNQEGGKPQMSFEGKPYEPLPGKSVMPGTAQTRLVGRHHTSDKPKSTSVTFTSAGRFQRSAPVAGQPDPSAPYTLTPAQKTVPGGDLAGTYAINGYALTLRYDSGKVERMRFFFEDGTTLWFEGDWLEQDKGK